MANWVSRLKQIEKTNGQGWRSWLALVLVIGMALGSTLFQPVVSQPSHVHPLPVALAQWQSSEGDYFDQIAPLNVGYLVWSKFPITIAIEPVQPNDSPRAPVWRSAVEQAAQEWNAFLPLAIVRDLPNGEPADITVRRKAPPLKREANGKLGRVRTAETQFKPVIQTLGTQKILQPRFEIWLKPGQSDRVLESAARHELGHALGIWGHSPVETDVMYPQQVRNPPSISARDINTLRRIYQQPTQLGWSIE